TVTGVCLLVGFASLGSFSARFTQVVGESPTAYRNRWAARGGPHVPGCYLFMRGVCMITNVSLVAVYCLDQDVARDFYVDVLGFQPRADVTAGEGFRWVTI